MNADVVIEAEEREANRSNGSKYNAVTHGLTAKTPVLPGENGELLQAKIDMYKTGVEAKTPLEEELARNAALASWRHERGIRNEVDRINRDNLTKAAEDQLRKTLEAEAIGERLLFDRRGPRELYPGRDFDNKQDRTSWSGEPNDPDQPKKLVICLESTLEGCIWLRQNWRELRDLLDTASVIQSHEKFTMIRLMGKQPINAISSPDVARVFLACHVLSPQFSYAFQELRSEIHEDRFKFHKGQLDRWNKIGLAPADPAEARAVLLGIIEEATERLLMLEAKHQEFAEQLGGPGNGGMSPDEDKTRAQLDRHLEILDRAVHRNLQGIAKLRRKEADGWGRTRQLREQRANERRTSAPVDDRLVVDEHGELRKAHGYDGNLEEGLIRFAGEFGPNNPGIGDEPRKEIEETHVRAVPDFARWARAEEERRRGGDQGLVPAGELGAGIGPGGPAEAGFGNGSEGVQRDDSVTQVLTEASCQSNIQNEIGGGGDPSGARDPRRSAAAGGRESSSAGGPRTTMTTDGLDKWPCSGPRQDASASGKRPRGSAGGSHSLDQRRSAGGSAGASHSANHGGLAGNKGLTKRFWKRDRKQWRKVLASMELERRKGRDREDLDALAQEEKLESVEWLLPNSVKMLREHSGGSP
jgi:hypothetical protein